MGLGLQLWAADGAQVLDTSWRMGRVLGQVVANGSSGSLNLPDLSQGTPWAIAITNGLQALAIPPRVTFTGTLMQWAYDNVSGGATYAATIVYGVY